MKKSKILSMFLAVVMILSCFTSAFAAAAVNESANVKNLIDAFGGDMTAAEPKEEDLSAYNKRISEQNTVMCYLLVNSSRFLRFESARPPFRPPEPSDNTNIYS